MFRVQLRNFRCFANLPPIEIRPITLLVGENSAGKTSFLAGIRFLFEALGHDSQNAFNRDPYFLGGFEEIAHQDRINGRSERFSLKVEISQDNVSHEFYFVKGSPQPVLEEYEFVSQYDKIHLCMSETNPFYKFVFLDANDTEILIDTLKERNSFPPPQFLRENMTYIPIVLEQIRFWMTQNKKEKGALPIAISEERLQEFVRRFQRSVHILRKEVFASAPVRTRPRRTYTPSEVVASSEGDHVPLELARAKRSKTNWASIQRNLAAFGEGSGLFTGIDIRLFGSKDVDPFQLIVRFGGLRRNIVDVGYGISQVLPIVYQIKNTKIYDAFLLQQPEVHLHPRAQAELGSVIVEARNSNKRSDRRGIFVIETHSDYIIDRIRILVSEGVLPRDDVTIVFFERINNGSLVSNLYLNKFGEIENAPQNFRSFFVQEHGRLLGI